MKDINRVDGDSYLTNRVEFHIKLRGLDIFIFGSGSQQHNWLMVLEYVIQSTPIQVTCCILINNTTPKCCNKGGYLPNVL